MKRVPVWALAALTLAGSTAGAAEATRVASSFEDKSPFGMFLDVAFVRTQEQATLTRDGHANGTVKAFNELHYQAVDTRLQMDAHVGLWHDFELHVGIPLDFGNTETWGYAQGASASNSSITNNCLAPDGNLLDPACLTTGAGEKPLFGVPRTSFRGGLGNAVFGLSYAFFNQAKDDTKPTWVATFQYEAPTAAQRDPTFVTSSVRRGNIGDRVHKYTLATSMSRKLGALEPYFDVRYTLPAVASGAYSNCDHPEVNLGAPSNCTNGTWTRKETGIAPPSVGSAFFGLELNAFEEPVVHQRLAFDARALATYVSAGRYYDELSGALGKLLWAEEYLQLGGSLGVVAQAADYVSFKATGTLLYSTPHALTAEDAGKDRNHDGAVDVQPGSTEANPSFDYRTDLVSRRFRAMDITTWRLDVTVTFAF